MDHILWLENSSLPPPTVPFVCSDVSICLSRDFENFACWPTTQGWELEKSRDLNQLALRCQSWLYFGLLSAILGDKFEIEAITKTDISGQTVLDSSGLPDLLRASLKRMSFELRKGRPSQRQTAHFNAVELEHAGVSLDDQASHLRPSRSSSLAEQAACCISHSVNKVKGTVIPFIIKHMERSNADRFSIDLWDCEPYAVLFSLDVLLDTLRKEMTKFSPLMQGLGPPETRFAELTRGVANSVYRIGRCPCLPCRLELSSSRCFTLLSLPESDSPISFDHSDCSYERCSAFNVNPASYEPKHSQRCDMCDSVEVSEEKLVNIISRDEIPLIRCIEGHQGQLQLTLVEAHSTSEYTAISHVWAGGLGNFQSNSLPACRIRSLMYDVAQTNISPSIRSLMLGRSGFVGKSALFWLDTLCIPVKREYADYRKMAIDSMARIYAGAENVLVLDPELESTHFARLKLDVDTQRLAISCSAWMARSWPLQEGALASSLLLKFADELISVNPQNEGEGKPLIHTTVECLDIPFMRLQDLQYKYAAQNPGWQEICLARWFRVTEEIIREDNDGEGSMWRFTWVWNSLRGRSTTQPEDVAAVLAALTDRSAGEIMSVPAKLRILALMKAQKTLPLPIIYSNASLEPNKSGNSRTWIPVLPGGPQRVGSLPLGFGQIIVSDEGVVIDFNGSEKTFSLICAAEVPSSGPFVLSDAVTHTAWFIKPHPPSVLDSNEAQQPRLFLMSEMQCSDGSGLQHGAYFIVEHAEGDRIQVKFIGHLNWSSDKTTASHNRPVIQTQLCKENCHSDRKIIIAFDTTSWPTLNWSRPDAFPFGQMGIDINLTMNTFPKVLFVLWIMYAISQSSQIFIKWRLDPVTWQSAGNALVFLLLYTPIVTRVGLCHLESQIRTRSHRQVARKKWAATFWDSNTSRRSLRELDRGMSQGIWAFLACTFIVSIALVVTLHVCIRLVNRSSKSVVNASLQNVATSTILAIFVETFFRLIIELVTSLQWYNSVHQYSDGPRPKYSWLHSERARTLGHRSKVVVAFIIWFPLVFVFAALVAFYYFFTIVDEVGLWNLFPLMVVGFVVCGTMIAFSILVRFVPDGRLRQIWRDSVGIQAVSADEEGRAHSTANLL